MIDIYLIRHGKASSGWDSLNPDLDIIGKKQSKKTDLRYQCGTCKKTSTQSGGIRAKKVEFKQ